MVLFGGQHGGSQQHGDGHGAYPTGDRREPSCHRGNALKVHITAKFPCCIAIHSYINDYRTGFNHLPGDKPSLAHSGNQNIRPAGHLRQILGPAVANGNGSIAVQCQKCHGFSYNIAASNDDTLLAGHVYTGAIDEGENAAGRTGGKKVIPNDNTTHILRMESVHILFGVDRG